MGCLVRSNTLKVRGTHIHNPLQVLEMLLKNWLGTLAFSYTLELGYKSVYSLKPSTAVIKDNNS